MNANKLSSILGADRLDDTGDDGLTDFVLRTAKSFPAKSPGDPNRLVQKRTAEEFKERFRVYFPSETAVKNSRGGPGSAGTICFQSKWYEGTKFPRQVLRECISQRPKILMHNKVGYIDYNFVLLFGSDTDAARFYLRDWTSLRRCRINRHVELGHMLEAQIYRRVPGAFSLYCSILLPSLLMATGVFSYKIEQPNIPS